MACKIKSLGYFDSRFKRLAKKYKTLSDELLELSKILAELPQQGADLGGGFYKIRLASQSKGGGKSGGFRVITYYLEENEEGQTLYLVTIYDKSEVNTIDKKALLSIVKSELE